jgi:glycosyltransferase involved in cell wall biosynthesis
MTAVLIPSYNESKTIGALVERLEGYGFPVYVVDDGSADGTGDIARSMGATVISHASNKGKGASLREGFARVTRDGFDRILMMDGDGQHLPEDAEGFFRKMDSTGADIVVGNRMTDTASMPRLRVAVNRFMSWLISKMAGQDIPDTQCGFRLVKSEVLENIRLDTSNYEIESEILIKAADKGYRIESIPIRTVYGGEPSRINPARDTIRFFAMILRLSLRRRS